MDQYNYLNDRTLCAKWILNDVRGMNPQSAAEQLYRRWIQR